MHRAFIAIVVITLAAWAPPRASGIDYTFRVQSGSWSDRMNCYLEGVPGADDTATIPTGRECRIEDAHEHIRKLIVNGRLVLKNGYTLTFHPEAANDLTVNGTLAFKDQTALLTTYHLVATGQGEITTEEGGRATIAASGIEPVEGWWFHILSDLTVKGSINVLLHVYNQGKLITDDASHDMEIGEADPGMAMLRMLRGNGTIRAVAGTLRLGYVGPAGGSPPWMMNLEVAGGTLVLSSRITSAPPWPLAVRVSSGTLRCEQSLRTLGEFDFTGGRIVVAQGKIVSFKPE